MLRRLFAVSAVVSCVVVANAAGAQSADTTKKEVKNVDPVGTYVTNLTVQGNPLSTTTKIEKKADGTYAGTVTSDAFPPLPVNSVKVEGNKIRVSISTPDGSEAVITMILEGNDFTGDWSMGGDGSRITGKKQP